MVVVKEASPRKLGVVSPPEAVASLPGEWESSLVEGRS